METAASSLAPFPSQMMGVQTNPFVSCFVHQMGLPTLFSEAADFSGITTEQQLNVDELVQHVSVRVDEGASTENSISASDVVSRWPKSETGALSNGESEETFVVDQPFLFFVRDTVDDITLVAGMINRPKAPQLFADLFLSQERSKDKAEPARPAA